MPSTPLQELDRRGPTCIVMWFCRGVLGVVLLSLAVAVVRHEFEVLRSSRVGPAFPPAMYGLLPAPRTSPVPKAKGAAGADFSQVYTSALALRHGESAYFPTTKAYADRFGRPAGYPPLMNWLYVPLTYLPYYQALLVHVVASMTLFAATTAWILWRVGLAQHIPGLWLVQGGLYLLTPVGFTHLERGQFDLFVASAAALAIACSFIPRGVLGSALLSGVLGTLKWTAAPFLGCFGAFAFVCGSGRRRWCYVLILMLMLIGTAVFWRGVIEYWHTIRVYEIDAQPKGITFQYYLPRPLAKLVPVLVTLCAVGWVTWRARTRPEREAMLLASGVPFSILLMSLVTCYGTVSYEYHTVAMLSTTPGLIVWLEKERRVPIGLKVAVALALGVFLCIAFRPFEMNRPFDGRSMTLVYASFGALMFGVSALIVAKVRLEHRADAQASDLSIASGERRGEAS